MQGAGGAKDDFVVHRSAVQRMRMQDQRHAGRTMVFRAINNFQMSVWGGDEKITFGIWIHKVKTTTNIVQQQDNIYCACEKLFGRGRANHINCGRAKFSLAHFLFGINILMAILQR